MTVSALLTQLYSRGIEIWGDGDKLSLKAPSGALTPELRDQLQTRKSEILAFLRGPAELSARPSCHLLSNASGSWIKSRRGRWPM